VCVCVCVCVCVHVCDKHSPVLRLSCAKKRQGHCFNSSNQWWTTRTASRRWYGRSWRPIKRSTMLDKKTDCDMRCGTPSSHLCVFIGATWAREATGRRLMPGTSSWRRHSCNPHHLPHSYNTYLSPTIQHAQTTPIIVTGDGA
jgi:hypothetical protein